MKIRLVQFPSVGSGVLEFVRTGKESTFPGELHDGWNLKGAPGNPFIHVPLSPVDFPTADAAMRAAREGLEVAEDDAAVRFAKELIETGWAVEVTN